MQTEEKPFHESIIDLIKDTDILEVRVLGDLIISTKIPKGHDEIIAAWQKKVGRTDAGERVTASVLKKKHALLAAASVNNDIEEVRGEVLCEVRGE